MCDTTRCLTCVDAPTHCSSCQTGLILLEGGCVDACPSGMYKDGGNCMICGNTCSTCHNSSECVTCLPQFALVVGACVTECGNGSVKIRLSSVSQWECLPCSSNCLYCSYSGTNASTTCLQCDVGYLHTGRCVDTCPMTTYSVTNTCVECVLPCKSCISATDCTSCQLGYGILLNYLCLPSCPSQFYLDEMTNTCLACPTSCYFCNAITCTKCFPNFFLQPDNNSSQCVLMCDDGYYSSIADGNCHICNPVCLTCVNTSTTCTSCR